MTNKTQREKTGQLIKSNNQPAPVLLAKSKKLQALVRKPSAVSQQNNAEDKPDHLDTKSQLAAELNKAKKIIESRIIEIKSAYPEAMKNRLFSIRYGSDELYKTMPIQKAFKQLNIQTNQIDFEKIKNLNCLGEATTPTTTHKV